MSEQIIDLVTFKELQETAGADFVTELVVAFFEEAPAMLEELRTAYATQATERFRRTAHSLKSNGDTFGARKLGAMARALELGEVRADDAAIAAISAEYERVAAALKELCHG